MISESCLTGFMRCLRGYCQLTLNAWCPLKGHTYLNKPSVCVTFQWTSGTKGLKIPSSKREKKSKCSIKKKATNAQFECFLKSSFLDFPIR